MTLCIAVYSVYIEMTYYFYNLLSTPPPSPPPWEIDVLWRLTLMCWCLTLANILDRLIKSWQYRLNINHKSPTGLRITLAGSVCEWMVIWLPTERTTLLIGYESGRFQIFFSKSIIIIVHYLAVPSHHFTSVKCFCHCTGHSIGIYRAPQWRIADL